MRRGALLLGLAATMAVAGGGAWLASTLGNAERAVVFTTAAFVPPRGDAWSISVTGMVYEPETNSPARRLGLSALRRALGLGGDSEAAELFRRRAAAFLVDRESGEEVRVRLPAAGAFTASLPPLRTGGDGRFSIQLRPSAKELRPLLRDRGGTGGWLEVEITERDGRDVLGRGWIQCVPPEGVTVVSDIDDTVKDTNVLVRREMIANTFLREFRAVPGMAEAYARWAAEGAAFHYLSAGPVPLQGFIEEFLAGAGFPPGELRMREFRWREENLSDLLSGDPAAFKGERLDALAAAFPRRRFVLVGDSGERDPEAYGAFARRHPGAVARIFIREVVPGGSPAERYAQAFEGVAAGIWTVFTDPGDLGPLPR